MSDKHFGNVEGVICGVCCSFENINTDRLRKQLTNAENKLYKDSDNTETMVDYLDDAIQAGETAHILTKILDHADQLKKLYARYRALHWEKQKRDIQ